MEGKPSFFRAHGKQIRIVGALVLALAMCTGLALYYLGPQSLRVAPASGAALVEAGKGLDDIMITADYAPDTRTLAVSQSFRLVNRTDEALDTLVLRAYPNALETVELSPAAGAGQYHTSYPAGFSAGKLDLHKLTVGAADAAWAYADDARTVLTIGLEQPWQPGAELNLKAEYSVLVPNAAYRMGVYDGVVSLGNVFLIPSVWQNGAWRDDPYYDTGDPFISECRNYHVAVTVPRGWKVGGTGYALPERETQGDVYRIEAPAVRDFALCLSKQYEVAQVMAGNVLVTGMARTQADASWMADLGAKGLTYLSGLLGDYPYPTFTLCEVAFSFGGMEYPACTMIASDQLAYKDSENSRMVVTHEVAHQWFYALVGNDSINQPWQDESACQYLMLRWAEDTQGPYLRETLETQIDDSYWLTLGSDVTPGMPIDIFPDPLSYSIGVYQQGVGVFTALEAWLGKDELAGFLRAYCDEYAFRLASREDFTACLNAYGGEDFAPLLVDYLDTLPE